MIDLEPLAAPLFVDGPYIDRAADAAGALVLSHSNPLRYRLYDMARESFVDLAGSEGDGTPITVTGAFYDEGAPVFRLVDYLHIVNHNLAGFTIELSDNGGATYGAPITRAGLTAEDTIVGLPAPVLANAYRFTATHTQDGAAGVKRLGGLHLGKVRLQPRVGLSVYEPNPSRALVEDKMGDGSTRRAYIYHADGSSKLRTIDVGFTGITQAEEDEMEEILLDNPEPFLFVPEPGDNPRLVHFCEIAAAGWTPRYLSLRKSAGKSLMFGLQEKGGA